MEIPLTESAKPFGRKEIDFMCGVVVKLLVLQIIEGLQARGFKGVRVGNLAGGQVWVLIRWQSRALNVSRNCH